MTPLGLPEPEILDVLASLGRLGIGGGAAYDALVAATARHHDLVLLTRDRRARATYDGLGVPYRFV